MADPVMPYQQYMLPTSATSVIPQALGQDYLNNLDQSLGLQENQQMNQALAQANMSGTASSGNTNFNLAQIAGNTQNQFANAYTGLANQATGQAQGQQFNTQYEQQGFQNRLQAMQQQYQNQRALMDLEARLSPGYSAPTFGQLFGQGAVQGMLNPMINFGIGAGNAAMSQGGQGYGSNAFGGGAQMAQGSFSAPAFAGGF